MSYEELSGMSLFQKGCFFGERFESLDQSCTLCPQHSYSMGGFNTECK
jgi:hypothetical protein